jgi:hypothetical protein
MRKFSRSKKPHEHEHADEAAEQKRESSLAGMRPIHIDSDEDRPTREDVEADKKERRPGGGKFIGF